MKKRIRFRFVLSALMIVTVVSSALPAAADSGPIPDGIGPFVDTDGSIFEDDVAALWAAGITSGCDEWMFCPDDVVTRAHMATFLARALELDVVDGNHFDDIADSPFRHQIESIAAAGVTSGCGERLFCPDLDVSRAEMASFLARGLGLPEATDSPFTDDDGSPHENDIAALAAAGITAGCGDGLYCPERSVTRAEMATFLTRAFDLEVPAELPTIPETVLDELNSVPGWPEGGIEAWRPLVAEFFPATEVDRAMRVLACESMGDPGARNPSSGASGLFQHIPRFWPERSAAAGYAGSSIFDPMANVAVAAWLVYDYPAGGWKHWVCKG